MAYHLCDFPAAYPRPSDFRVHRKYGSGLPYRDTRIDMSLRRVWNPCANLCQY